ncbi:MAG: serine/threonine protein kinase [Deltaproteobacteria bacterium]|nr:serine/threonine protein kinase [Deltaproteobacteria bacterium]
MSDLELLVSDLEPGTRLSERYKVVQKIADGAVASVYRAEDERDGSIVALKIPDPIRSADPVGRQRFLREFDVLSKLNHPNIARSLRLERHADLDLLVLEFIEGETLAKRLERGRLGAHEALAFARKLTEALIACHDADVLHRDLKPANVILHPDRGPVVLDFGVAWFSSAANLTRTGAVIGTPQYLAPEVFSSSLYDARADVYSLGAILFEMLTGRPVYLADSVAELVDAHRLGSPPTVLSLRPDISPKISEVVTRAIAPRPESRYSSARELDRALAQKAVAFGRELAHRLPCATCGTSLVIDLEFCPGCGREVSWELTDGPCAVQLEEVNNPSRIEDWLQQRYGHALTRSVFGLSRRVSQTPVPLVVRASLASAEQLAAEARERGAKANVIRARTVLGAKLEVRSATLVEGLAASGFHFGAVVVGGLVMIGLGASFPMIALLPMVMGVAGVAVARTYVRRPILVPRRRPGERTSFSDRISAIRASLERLSTQRGRNVAAAAIARAAPVLLGDTQGLSSSAADDALRGLEATLEAARAVDAESAFLATTSRSRLSAELIEVGSRAARGDPDATTRLADLETQKRSLMEASVRHDLAARKALEGLEEIAAALSTRTTQVD